MLNYATLQWQSAFLNRTYFSMKHNVEASREPLVIPTYGLGAPEKNPLFFEKRVYQGSCGKVYPVPFIDKVFDVPKAQSYDSVRLENEYVRLVMLPEIGGRIFLGQDKVNDDYDFFYRQDVIKPALVGLAGPWISGGVEFNWPQHHRPGTYMPADVHLEEGADGSQTVWMSEHDPLNRLKGMHGIRMQPGSALVELKARLFNRTPYTQTFLWWANVAAKVHDNYQSFFPADVHYVADHAVRAQSGFPIANNDYYGVDYAAKPGANDLSWYKNIQVPTSYMVCDTSFNFFGGYDFDAEGGFIHVANKHISPGKKQWTWGNHEFGWAWDRELTDENGPYVELMAGVYTDNQPDFTYLQPGETKTFSQFWWPYKKIGPVQNATKDAAVRLVLNEDGTLDLGAVVSRADVHYVADHAVRAQSGFPIANNDYYGVDYAAKPGANDLSWYKNIQVPTSYMVCDTSFNFFGGYDFDAEGGFIHVANKHISPGKKQWTWGNHEFGWAWDRELTDENGPYVELMAGVYTDNQPDFTYLQPGETKTFSQFWWPYKKIGPVQNATKDAAVRLVLNEDGTLDLGAVVSREFKGARILLTDSDQVLIDERVNLSPDAPWQNQSIQFAGDAIHTLELSVEGLVSYRPVDVSTLERNREVATEPPMPDAIDTIEELYLTAEHLEQYRHPTRYPELYWDEILRRDPLDVRTNIAYGRRQLNQGLLDEAAQYFEQAIKRLTSRHPNPYTGEAHYYLGLTRRFQNRLSEAYGLLYKATWDASWRSAAYYELALLDCRQGDLETALQHCEAVLDTNRQNNKAQVLKALVLGKLGRDGSQVLADLLAVDPLDHWARHASGDVETFLAQSRNDAQTVLDIVYDYVDAGFRPEAIALLELHHSHAVHGVAVPNPLEKSQMTQYALAWLTRQRRAP